MTAFRLPLSGNVSQLISPWSGWFGNSQLGLIKPDETFFLVVNTKAQ